jgi:hypothetical protein
MANEKHTKDQGKTVVADGDKKKTGLAKLESKLPDWFTKAIRTPRMWKNFTRCMIATFATLILMLVQKCKQCCYFVLLSRLTGVMPDGSARAGLLTDSSEHARTSGVLWLDRELQSSTRHFLHNHRARSTLCDSDR